MLYIVATPIGNLADISERAVHILRDVAYIAAEDTRHTARLLRHLGISTRLVSCHEHNERQRADKFLHDLRAGQSIALVSDAGTPLISDPGFVTVRAVRAEGLPVVPIPGASSVITALSVAGLPTDRFAFEGFLPNKITARENRLRELQTSPYTLIILESSHRIQASIAAMGDIFGAERLACIARELTKRFEEVHTARLADLQTWLQEYPERCKGEFVVLVNAAIPDASVSAQTQTTLELLLQELPLKQAVSLAAKITQTPKNTLYQLALQWQQHQ